MPKLYLENLNSDVVEEDDNMTDVEEEMAYHQKIPTPENIQEGKFQTIANSLPPFQDR